MSPEPYVFPLTLPSPPNTGERDGVRGVSEISVFFQKLLIDNIQCL
jgi:hypothetical protein